MIKSSFRLVNIFYNNSKIVSLTTKQPLWSLLHTPVFAFSKDSNHSDHKGKHDGPDIKHDHHEHKHEHKHQHKHEHGPNCNHNHDDRNQNHEHHHHKHHQHGPNCHHEHHETPPNVKLSKLTFDELIELNNTESLKYAKLIVEQQEKNKEKNRAEIQNLRKSLDFFKKIEEQIKEKEKKLTQNIQIYEQQAKHSRKRAEKQIDESKTFAVTKIAKQLLEVADCLAQCKKLANQYLTQNKEDQYLRLIASSQDKVKQILRNYGIEEFDPIGQEYNPNTQQSLLQIPAPPGNRVNEVALTMRTGYTIKGRLLRSARVGIFS